jgi:hypothetical protein
MTAVIALVLFLLSRNAIAQQGTELSATLGVVEGTVLDPEGHPVADASVYYEPTDLPAVGHPRTVATDKSGNFILRRITPGKITIIAYKESDLYSHSIFAFNAPPPNSMPRIEIKAGEVIRGLVIHLGPKSALLQLVILDAVTGEPPEQIKFQLCRADHPGNVGYCISGSGAVSASSGEISEFIPSSTPVSILVGAPKYSDWTYRNDVTGESVLTLGPGESRRVFVRLRPTGGS